MMTPIVMLCQVAGAAYAQLPAACREPQTRLPPPRPYSAPSDDDAEAIAQLGVACGIIAAAGACGQLAGAGRGDLCGCSCSDHLATTCTDDDAAAEALTSTPGSAGYACDAILAGGVCEQLAALGVADLCACSCGPPGCLNFGAAAARVLGYDCETILAGGACDQILDAGYGYLCGCACRVEAKGEMCADNDAGAAALPGIGDNGAHSCDAVFMAGLCAQLERLGQAAVCGCACGPDPPAMAQFVDDAREFDPTASCYDGSQCCERPFWTDDDGYSCAEYARNGWCCDMEGDSGCATEHARKGVSQWEACCGTCTEEVGGVRRLKAHPVADDNVLFANLLTEIDVHIPPPEEPRACAYFHEGNIRRG
jgi:hypothetical protein